MTISYRLLLLIMLYSIRVSAQQGGQSIYQSLTLAPSARTLALGGRLVSLQDSDLVLSLINPAALYESSTRQIAINQNFYYSGSAYTTVIGAHHLTKQNITVSGALQYLNHGDIIAADEFGNKTGTFTAGEYSIVLGAAKKLFDPLSVGIHLKYVGSQIESYRSNGLGIDLGALYSLPSGRSSLGLAIRNIGSQWSYYQDQKESLPMDILLGYSQRLKYVPFVFTITAHHLTRWNLSIIEEVQDPIFGEAPRTTSVFSKAVDNLVRHLTIGGEMYLGSHSPIRLRISYDHHRRRELSDQNYGGLSGFSGGVGIKVSRILFDYGLAQYHLAGAVHALGLSYRWR